MISHLVGGFKHFFIGDIPIVILVGGLEHEFYFP